MRLAAQQPESQQLQTSHQNSLQLGTESTQRQSRQSSAASQQRNQSTMIVPNTPNQKRSLFNNPSKSISSNPVKNSDLLVPRSNNPNINRQLYQQSQVNKKSLIPTQNVLQPLKSSSFAFSSNLSGSTMQGQSNGFMLNNSLKTNNKTPVQKYQQQQQPASFKISKPQQIKGSASRKNEEIIVIPPPPQQPQQQFNNFTNNSVPDSPQRQPHLSAVASEIRKHGRKFLPHQGENISDENKPPVENSAILPVQQAQNQEAIIEQHDPNKILRLLLSTRKHNWQEAIKHSLQNRQFTFIHLHFLDISFEPFDRLLLINQSRSLTYLSLSFCDNKFFNDESLIFLSNINIPSLTQVYINVAGTQCSHIGANFLLFDFNYVDNVQISVGKYNGNEDPLQPSRVSTFTYSKQAQYINIDFSHECSINKSEILSLSDSLQKSKHQHLLLNLSGIPFGNEPGNLTSEKIRLLAKCICEIQHLNIVFASTKLSRKQISLFLHSLLDSSQTDNSTRQSHYNEHICTITMDMRDTFDRFDQSFMKHFLAFKSLSTLKLIIDCEKQVKQQFEGESAYCLGDCLISSTTLNSISISVNETQSIFHLNKLSHNLSIDAQSCDVSAYKLVDISKSLSFYPDIKHLNLNLSHNWKLSFTNIRKMFENLPYLSQLDSLHLDIRSVFIYEIEFITLFFLLNRIPQLTIIHDFKDANLVHFADNNRTLQLSFKGPFTRSKITSIHDMHAFCTAIESSMALLPTLANIETLQMTFFFNYGLRGDSLHRLCGTISRFTQLKTLNLNFNSCFLQFEDIVFFCNGLNEMQNNPIETLKLSFTNNDSVTSNSLVRIAKILHQFPRLKQLHVICETQELLLGMPSEHSQNLYAIFETFNSKKPIANNNNNQSQRLVANVYSVLSHDIDQTVYIDRKQQFRAHQNEFLKRTQHVVLHGLDPDEADEDPYIDQDTAESDNQIQSDHTLSPPSSSDKLVIKEPTKRNRIIKTTVHNLITLHFREDIRYSNDELMQLGLDLALDSSVHQLITIPQKPIIDNMFNYIKRVRLSAIFFEQIAAPYMEFNPKQIFCDLYY